MYVLEESVSKYIFVKKLYIKYPFVRSVSRGWFGLFGNCSCKILYIAVEFNDVFVLKPVSFTPNYVTWRGFKPWTLAYRKSRVVGFVTYRILCLATVDSIPVSFTLKLWTPHVVRDAQLNKVDAPCLCPLFYRLRNLHCMELSKFS
jgi:hypothetical protein